MSTRHPGLLCLSLLAITLATPALAAKRKTEEPDHSKRPECVALQARYAERATEARAAIDTRMADRAVELRRDLVGLRREYRAGCGELPAAMGEDAGMEKAFHAMRRDIERAEDTAAKQALKEAKSDARDAKREAKRDARAAGQTAATVETPALKPGADAERCATFMADLRATAARHAACAKGDKACRKQESMTFSVTQGTYAGRCGELPKDLRRLK